MSYMASCTQVHTSLQTLTVCVSNTSPCTHSHPFPAEELTPGPANSLPPGSSRAGLCCRCYSSCSCSPTPELTLATELVVYPPACCACIINRVISCSHSLTKLLRVDRRTDGSLKSTCRERRQEGGRRRKLAHSLLWK